MQDYYGLVSFSQTASQLSPFHSGGRFLSNALIGTDLGLDLHFILPIGLVVIVVGFLVGKKIYLDVFIRD